MQFFFALSCTLAVLAVSYGASEASNSDRDVGQPRAAEIRTNEEVITDVRTSDGAEIDLQSAAVAYNIDNEETDEPVREKRTLLLRRLMRRKQGCGGTGCSTGCNQGCDRPYPCASISCGGCGGPTPCSPEVVVVPHPVPVSRPVPVPVPVVKVVDRPVLVSHPVAVPVTKFVPVPVPVEAPRPCCAQAISPCSCSG